jgi:hypothetical protein
MQDRGIAPSAEILSTAAALQARYGEPALALRMLDIVRGLLERNAAVEVGLLEVEVGVGVGERTKKQQRLLFAYTRVLRGLVDRGELKQARQVAELLHSHLGYVEGGGGSRDARADAVLQFLRLLEVKGPSAKPEPLKDYFYPFLKKRDPEVCLFSNLKKCLLYFPPSSISKLPSFPVGGKTFCYAFIRWDSRRVVRPLAQLIKTLNAAPGSHANSL